MSTRLARMRDLVIRGRKALLPDGGTISKIPLLDMLAHNWHLGFISFGGPTVHFQMFRELFVEKYGWLDDTAYDELFGLCQALSGPGSTKMLYIINVMHYGFDCGVAAFFVWSLPMAIASWGLAMGVGQIQDELPGPAYALLSGLNSATVGIVALAAVQLSQKAITDRLTRTIVFLGGTAGMLYNALWYFPVLIAVGGLMTTISDLRLVQRSWRALSRDQPPPRQADDDINLETLEQRREASSVRHRTSRQDEAQPPQEQQSQSKLLSWKTGVIVLTSFFVSFAIVMACRGIYSDRNRAFDLFANMYLAGTIIFGGGPVVIPLLREYIVTPGWVSSRDFLLGLAIVQAFPGPNFNFAVYLGALAVQGSSTPTIGGAATAFLGIFVPGMWLATGLLGIWSSVRKAHAVRAALRGVHAAAVGLVFTAVYRLFEIGYLDAEVRNGGSLSRDPWWVVIVATSFVGGMHYKLPPPAAILLGAVMGLIWYAVVRA
ncbi:hypothetical protein M409DRAFT_30126 [Zasmidium cellare ATCC 36951]|uniref:Chromate ion transporter n=1 Tax=Zasmidium cellare ATCC 36951 TaxID=1080233 RepID=A0A6A6BXE1_ZASCE|nr:uncharacterized protein M409DRAFT_30126 [Zasmidium cellare ATCC 36951]KAF2159375.1 hypothetical protein M409DRAFT_30126 [Zasmidium cellare ATCC 36951]